ncbi:type II toxin-antitoxin system RelE/ParE family toxin [Marinomonas rhizomae]|uniref:Plasmid stabilization system protein ParE n=1 Tax=Marinomonas rhizomae TaxID=491948 RepID=A0A366JBL3_9GAMM|nr:type II toxin-antitoxin system RelE/ParE family toxin [Marinomonas rhizomae]RBP83288.1 plasmid stabilization system protein ParE [Marinomonas rhizomae]
MIFNIFFTPSAENDLLNAKQFYAKINKALGQYCVDSLMLDIERLRFFAGIHPSINGSFRVLARSFPFSIYYQVIKDRVLILAVLDNRQDPKSIEHRLTNR